MKTLKLIILLLVSVSPSLMAADWTELHTASNATGASGSTLAATITSSSPGSVLAVFVACGNAAGTVPTVSTVADNINTSAAYTQLVGKNDVGNKNDAEIWVALTPTSGATTVTVTMTASCTQFIDVYVTEFVPPTGSTLSKETVTGTGINTAFGNSTSCTAGSITPVGTDDLILAGCEAPTVSAANNSYNLRSTADGNGWADKFPISGATSVTMTTTSGVWDAVIGAIKAVGGGGGTVRHRAWVVQSQ